MTNCDPRIEAYMEAVETGKVEASKDVKALMKHVRKCFETEDIYVDQQQLTDYLGLARYFPYDEVFPWQQFVIGLHDCTYWRENGRPRWPDLFCLIGRGAGKDGTIALESTALASEYNGIREYDVDICANNEDQALRPVQDIVGAFEQPKWIKKLQRFFKWTREKVVCKSTRSTIKGHTNNPGGKDGLRSGMVVLNEIHQYQDYKNINVFTTGLGKKKHPRRSYYTTQGDVREGPLDDLLETAEGILFGGEPDNGLLPFICRLDSKAEVHDEKNWEKANPSLRYLPDLMEEIRKEYRDWLKRPEKFTAYSKLIDYSAKSYLKSRGSRGTLNISAMAQSDKLFNEKLEKLMNEYFKSFFESPNAVLPLFEGYSYTDIGSKTYSEGTSRDIKSQYDDIFDFTARGFSMPPALAKGDVQDTEKAVDEMLTFCLDPLAQMLMQEINRKRIGKNGIQKGTKLQINTMRVKHIDMFDIATSADKLISSGTYTVNMILRALGEMPIDEDWADQHFITKNYSTIQEILEEQQKGGGKNAKTG